MFGYTLTRNVVHARLLKQCFRCVACLYAAHGLSVMRTTLEVLLDPSFTGAVAARLIITKWRA